MIIEVFALMLCFAVVIFITAFHFENYPTFIVSGIAFLLLALGIFTTGLTTQVGVGNVYVYGANFTGYHWDYDYGGEASPKDYELFHVEETNIYETSEGLNNVFLATFLLMLSFFCFGCALIYATPKKDREYGSERE